MSQIYGKSEPERLKQLQDQYDEAYDFFRAAALIEEKTGRPAGLEKYKQQMLDAHNRAQKLREGLS